jgi:hypothetical protein
MSTLFARKLERRGHALGFANDDLDITLTSNGRWAARDGHAAPGDELALRALYSARIRR